MNVAEAASERGCGSGCSGFNPMVVVEGWLATLSGEAGLEHEILEKELLIGSL